MHRNVRRKDRELSIDLATKLFSECEYGFLCTVDIDGQPYGIPLNYIYKDNCVYFHCALEGHKLENIKANKKVSFCVVGRTKVIPDKFTTQYESAVAFGSASEVYGSEKQDALFSFLEKYSPSFLEEGKKFIDKMSEKVRVIRIDIDHITGKARK
ncbi:MAG TPA: pyridoxamine 5'-phosphate oxidase family protein [Syntrophales bacterium]|nr:pyridoxamine 5'-phosphate oxidase family protein [Syntrophales bacterium]